MKKTRVYFDAIHDDTCVTTDLAPYHSSTTINNKFIDPRRRETKLDNSRPFFNQHSNSSSFYLNEYHPNCKMRAYSNKKYNQLFNYFNLITIFGLVVFGFQTVNAKPEVFTNAFLVKMKQPLVRHLADQVAQRNGFVNFGPVSFFTSYLIINYY